MIFTDTSALYAVLDRDDEFHGAAREVWVRELEGGGQFLTTNYVLLECFALVQGRMGMAALRTLHHDLLPVLQLEWVTEEDHRVAAEAVLTAGRRDLSLVDCSSFRVMRRLGLMTAFCFDEDFGEQGFTALPG